MDSSGKKILEPGAVMAMNEYVPQHMVQIPLEEYRRYIESTIKGPTVEITIEEYDSIRGANSDLQHRLYRAESRIRELETEIEHLRDIQEEIDEHTDIVTKMVADDVTEKIMKDLLQLSDEQKKEIRAKWQIVTDSDTKTAEIKGKRGNL